MQKRCNNCRTIKPIEEFYRMTAARDGRRPECKACTAARRKRWYRENRKDEIARVEEWRKTNPDHFQEYQRQYRARPERKAAMRADHLRRTFGITVEEYDRLLAEQGGGCAICGRRPRNDISLHVDHDHDTGRVRGLLCVCCNNGLGQFREDPELLTRAIAYLNG